jgi:hypothetical protein
MRALGVLGATTLAACSFVFPFAEYDRDYGIDSGGTPDVVVVDVGAEADAPPVCAETASSNNCGECGHSCLGAACVFGLWCVSESVANLPYTDIVGIALDSTNVYGVGTFGADGTVGRVAKANTATVVVLAAKAGLPVRVVARGTDLYWTTKAPSGGIAHARTDGDGGSPPDASFLVSQPSSPLTIAANDTSIFWTTAPERGEVWRTSRASPDPPTRVWEGPDAMAVAIDSEFIYWTVGGADGRIMRAKLDGSDKVPLVASTPWPNAIMVDNTHVYWTASPPAAAGGTIMRAPKEGGSPPVQLAGAQKGPGAIAADETRVYWVTSEGVWRVSKAGGPTLSLASSTDNLDLAVDATHVYWVTRKGGVFNDQQHEVRRVAK